jgi:hypothetical protein
MINSNEMVRELMYDVPGTGIRCSMVRNGISSYRINDYGINDYGINGYGVRWHDILSLVVR